MASTPRLRLKVIRKKKNLIWVTRKNGFYRAFIFSRIKILFFASYLLNYKYQNGCNRWLPDPSREAICDLSGSWTKKQSHSGQVFGEMPGCLVAWLPGMDPRHRSREHRHFQEPMPDDLLKSSQTNGKWIGNEPRRALCGLVPGHFLGTSPPSPSLNGSNDAPVDLKPGGLGKLRACFAVQPDLPDVENNAQSALLGDYWWGKAIFS